jgi:site-specific recombinase XerD
MDSRAGGVTEGRNNGATLEDLRHFAGHSNIGTTARYDRMTPETNARVMHLRVAGRAPKNNV